MPFESFSTPTEMPTSGIKMRSAVGPHSAYSTPYSSGRGFASRAWGAAATGSMKGGRNAANRVFPAIVNSPWGQRQPATGGSPATSQATAGQPSRAAGPRGGGRGVSQDTRMKGIEGRRIMSGGGTPWLDMATTPGAGQSLGPIGDWRTINNRTIGKGNGILGNAIDRGIRGMGHGAIEGTRQAWESSRPEEPVDIGFNPFEAVETEDLS